MTSENGVNPEGRSVSSPVRPLCDLVLSLASTSRAPRRLEGAPGYSGTMGMDVNNICIVGCNQTTDAVRGRRARMYSLNRGCREVFSTSSYASRTQEYTRINLATLEHVAVRKGRLLLTNGVWVCGRWWVQSFRVTKQEFAQDTEKALKPHTFL